MLDRTTNWNLLMRTVIAPTVPQSTPLSHQSIAIRYWYSYTQPSLLGALLLCEKYHLYITSKCICRCGFNKLEMMLKYVPKVVNKCVCACLSIPLGADRVTIEEYPMDPLTPTETSLSQRSPIFPRVPRVSSITLKTVIISSFSISSRHPAWTQSPQRMWLFPASYKAQNNQNVHFESWLDSNTPNQLFLPLYWWLN